MSSTSTESSLAEPSLAEPSLAEPRWLERWRIKRAGRRDRVMYRAVPFSEHTPWTRGMHARFVGLALDARRTLMDRRDELEQERARLHVVLRQPRSACPIERPTAASDSRERHVWATRARLLAQQTERVRVAQVRLGTVAEELEALVDRETYVVDAHEQAYLLRVHRYNAARAGRTAAATAMLAAPQFVLPSVARAVHPPLFDYITAA
jgi:hypothetical protein